MLLGFIEYCQDVSLMGILAIVKRILSLIQIIVPIVLIVFASIGVVKIVRNLDEKKKLSNVIRKFIAAGVVFFIPVIVNAVMLMLGYTFDFSACWLSANDKIQINTTYQQIEEENLVSLLLDSDEYEKGKPKGSLAMAKLAVRVAPIATPDETKVLAPWNFHDDSISAKCGSYYTPNPWYPPSKVDVRYKDFEKIMDAVMNDKKPGNRAYGSCAQAAGGIVRAVADPDFETLNPNAQIDYMSQNTDKWTLVMQLKPGDKLDEKCEPGDVLITETGWTHTMIYVGNEIVREKFPNSHGNIFQAGYDDCDHARYPRIDYINVTPVPFNVYRPTGGGNFKYDFIDIEKVLNS